jgi:hypothetical protein
VNSDDPLATAIAVWQRKHRVADDDPIIAVLDLVRLQLQNAPRNRDNTETAPPSFEDFRGTVELLDRRSKAFIHQASDLTADLRRFSLNVQRLQSARLLTQLLLVALSILVGGFLARLL